jgi:hypothetical protein
VNISIFTSISRQCNKVAHGLASLSIYKLIYHKVCHKVWLKQQNTPNITNKGTKL